MSKTVLIVDDYEDVREIMKIFVRANGYDVISASDGYKAVESAREHKPDLILMDLAMPSMDGLTATEIIRESGSFAKVPIIAITAHHDSFFKIAIEAGITEVLGKPLNLDKLESVLTK